MFCGLPIPFRSRSGHNASTMEPREKNKLRKKQKKVQLASSDQFQYQGKPPKGPARACNSSRVPTAHKSFHNAQHGETPNDTENKERSNIAKPHSDQSQIQVSPLRL
ncbi:hypothetical protein NEUTE1DRAFT_121528 [Neurospora tetrasperma FGSC 2508]|uniref:Uncharacterized protein n=1 Tax=Neurospora tetrasperma (strain FGSC 2508 / ATCC MYA-4615 / P0657) TaxID=510951 RepID=F8MID3_NEUT8|nr:uncharacterized protein NEUTE1DRAFT_121528 [Neurospora tetrasperma FGSC 2508]EGO59787.1 hypothetical protein NEUTE1DRAFT_121528 [Neurospora tetrasperma FGSC 2508]